MKFVAVVLSVFGFLLPAAGDAATVSVLGVNSGAWSQVDSGKTTALGAGASWTVAPETLPNSVWSQIDPCISACSPFDPKVYGTGEVIDTAPLSGWQKIPFFAVWAGGANEAVLSFAKPQKVLKLLWGSLDRTNMIEFFLGQDVVTVAGADLPSGLVKNPGQGAALLRISDVLFDRVRFTSQAGAFEMANIATVAAVPLPPGLALLGGAFGLMGLAARRRARRA